jgi:His-Xaa-Ser system protein HxsD
MVLSSRVYSLETIKKAAYRFSDVASFDIEPSGDEIRCIIRLNSGSTDDEQMDRIVSAFRNEVLDQDLRVTVAKETEAARNAILAFALSKTGLQG